MLLFQKLAVAMKIATNRFESDLSYGQTLKRTKFDLDSVPVRDYTDNTDYTIDNPTDTSELMTVNKDYIIAFRISDLAKVQSGPLKPETYLAGELAKKMKIKVDADVLAEVVNAANTFDNGDLTSAASSGTPITLTTTNFPQVATQSQAKLLANNVDASTGVCWVVDPYFNSLAYQYLIGKNNDMSVDNLNNGYSGKYLNAEVYVSTNLTANITLTWATNPTAGQVVTIAGKTFTFVAALTATPGEVLIAGTRDLTAANFVQAISAINARVNAPTVTPAGSGVNYVEFTGSNLNALFGLGLSAVDTAGTDVTVITGKGMGRVAFSTTITGATSTNIISMFYGKKNVIDLAVQISSNMRVKEDPFREGSILTFRRVAAIKTFSDAAQQFLNCKIAA